MQIHPSALKGRPRWEHLCLFLQPTQPCECDSNPRPDCLPLLSVPDSIHRLSPCAPTPSSLGAAAVEVRRERKVHGQERGRGISTFRFVIYVDTSAETRTKRHGKIKRGLKHSHVGARSVLRGVVENWLEASLTDRSIDL